MIKTTATLILTLFASTQLMAQVAAPTVPNKWTNESELSLVTVSGNTDSESYSGKQKSSYTFDKNVLGVSGRYLQTKTAGVVTAKAWDAGLRYERELTEWWSAFVGHGAESDAYAGYVQRDNTDIGGKYFLTKNETTIWFAELGYRRTEENPVAGDKFSTNYGRLYSEVSKTFDTNWSIKFWAEYLPNFTKTESYLANAEPSVSVMINQIFSLKSAYLIKYQNAPTVTPFKYVDTTFTTSLVAKF